LLSKFFALLLILSFIAGQLIRFDIFGVQFPFLDAAVILFIMYHILAKQFLWEKYMKQKWLLMFIGVLIVSNLINLPKYSFAENVTGSLYILRFIIYSLIIGVKMKGQAKCPVPTEKIICGIGLTITLIGIFQFFFLPDLRFLQYQNWDDHLNRLTFPYLDPSFAGAILLVFLIVNLYGQTKKSISTIIISITEILAIFLTFSRATWVTGGIVLLMMVFWRSRGIGKMRVIRVVGGVILIAVMVCIIFAKFGSYGNRLFRTETILSRTTSMQKGFQIWQKNPVFGVGFNSYKTYQIKNGYYVKNNLENRGEASVENSYIFVLATSGIVGLLAFLGWVFGAFRELRGVRRYVFASVLIGSLFNNLLFYPFILLIIFWILNEGILRPPRAVSG
jgi:O-antigen ligase